MHRLRAPPRRRGVEGTALRGLLPDRGHQVGEESEFKAEIKKAEVLNPEIGTKPRVYYLNIPKKLIDGTVYDPIAKEVIIGATCTLSGKAKKTVTTDAFGNFWFHGLADGN